MERLPTLDRAAVRRGDAAWLEQMRHSEDSLTILCSHGKVAVAAGPFLCVLPYRVARKELPEAVEIFLGQADDKVWFALEVEPEALPLVGAALEWSDLRRSGSSLPPAEVAIMAYAQGMSRWIRTTIYCSGCGSPLLLKNGGHVRQCSDSSCLTDHFPRTDPAIIVLVTREDRCLLARHQGRATSFFTTLAGFLEPGETLEEAVRREVHEEVGIHVAALSYFGSQPWPFPSSLMVGFYASTEEEDLVLDEAELIEARWFTREELRSPAGFELSPPVSIARQLIDGWLEERK